MLTDKYLQGIPEGSRASRKNSLLNREFLSEENLAKVQALNAIAARRGQTLAQMALAWCLRDPRVTSVLSGASAPEQIAQNVAALGHLDFQAEELAEIDRYATESGINRWARSSQAG
jgi:L-glyceraldehyde 3-phosphate reductase